MNAGTLLLLVLLLACPLSMFFMHGRGGHGAHAQDSGSAEPDETGHTGHNGHSVQYSGESIDELRRKQLELEREIRERETAGVDSAAR